MKKKKTLKIPCANKQFGCKAIIEVSNLKQWYCKDCQKERWRKWYKKEKKAKENPELQKSTLISCKIIER